MVSSYLSETKTSEMADLVGPGSWNVDMEVNLFHAMRGHKPVGEILLSPAILKYF